MSVCMAVMPSTILNFKIALMIISTASMILTMELESCSTSLAETTHRALDKRQSIPTNRFGQRHGASAAHDITSSNRSLLAVQLDFERRQKRKTDQAGSSLTISPIVPTTSPVIVSANAPAVVVSETVPAGVVSDKVPDNTAIVNVPDNSVDVAVTQQQAPIRDEMDVDDPVLMTNPGHMTTDISMMPIISHHSFDVGSEVNEDTYAFPSQTSDTISIMITLTISLKRPKTRNPLIFMGTNPQHSSNVSRGCPLKMVICTNHQEQLKMTYTVR